MRSKFYAISAPIGGDLDHPESYLNIDADIKTLYDSATYFASKTAHLAALKAAQEYALYKNESCTGGFLVSYDGSMRAYDYKVAVPPAALAEALVSVEQRLLREIKMDFLFYAALKLRADNSEAEVERP